MTKSKLYVELDCAIWKNRKGQDHREDGPAVVFISGDILWYLHGKLHRPDGPAIVYENSYSYWYLNGHEYSEEDYVNKLSKIQNQGNT